MEDTNMKKKTYVQPAIEVVKLQSQVMMQIGSPGSNYGVNQNLSTIEEVDDGW